MKNFDSHNVGSPSPGTTWDSIRTRLMENGCRDQDRLLDGAPGLMLYPAQNVSKNNYFPRPSNVETN